MTKSKPKTKTAAHDSPNGSFSPGTPRGLAEQCNQPLETDQKTAFPFPEQINGEQLAGLLGLSKRRVAQLAEAGIIPRLARGTYAFPEAVTKFCEYQRRHLDDDSERRFREARAKLTETRQRKAQLELDLMTGKSLRTDIALDLFRGFILAARSRLLALPTSCAPIVADLSKPAECHKVLHNAVYEALTELAGASEETARLTVERYRAELNMDPTPNRQEQPLDEDL